MRHRPPSICLLVGCTKRKRLPVASDLRFGAMAPGPAEEVASAWVARERRSFDRLPAEQMYSGTGWRRSLEALAAARKNSQASEMFVLSAGMGLVSMQQRIPAYSATFAGGEDRVADRIEGQESTSAAHRAWWSVLGTGSQDQHRAVLEAAAPHTIVAAAFGADYLDALMDDLECLARELGPDRFYIICIGADATRMPTPLRECLLPFDVSIEGLLGVARSALNAAALEWLVSHVGQLPWRRSSVRTLVGSVMERCGRTAAIEKRITSMADSEIRMWISARLAQDPLATRTRLLRELRRDGSCEQGRFARLFEQVCDDRRLLGKA